MDKRITGNVKWGVPILAAIALMIGVVYYATLDTNESTSVTDIMNNSDQYVGRTVAVRGEVDDISGSQTMILDEEGEVMGDEVLVISRQPLEPIGGAGDDFLFDEGQDIEVAGEVRTFNREELEDELGITLDERTYFDWEGRPVIVATTVHGTE